MIPGAAGLLGDPWYPSPLVVPTACDILEPDRYPCRSLKQRLEVEGAGRSGIAPGIVAPNLAKLSKVKRGT